MNCSAVIWVSSFRSVTFQLAPRSALTARVAWVPATHQRLATSQVTASGVRGLSSATDFQLPPLASALQTLR